MSHSTADGSVTVELTEVEAYAGEADPASHAFRGRTPRNGVMFGPAGVLYVYFSYGMHWCANVVTGRDGVASAVLLRAGRVVAGVELARARRGPRVGDRSLARGPACLTQALGLRGDAYGTDLLDPTAAVRLHIGRPLDPARIACGPRVGVAAAAEARWRFWVDGDPTVSAYQRSPRAAR
jgi:DNA-3-methyladenine glycosylase